jgi:Raf kinase inhibitor-like YbhB/YbcL family protein
MHPRTFRARALSVLVTTAGIIVCLQSSGCGRSDPLPVEDSKPPTIALRSSAFMDGGVIPTPFTCDGSDSSPPLGWSGVPTSARSLALICDDPDAPRGTWSHWVVFNLPAQATALKQSVPAGKIISRVFVDGLKSPDENSLAGVQGQNDFGKTGYGGPCPPSGSHRYFFRLYALDTTLGLESDVARPQVLKAITGHILGEGRLMGKYARTTGK